MTPSRFADALRLIADALFRAWPERSRQRRRLTELTDAQLRDVGLSRADVRRETGKPVWRD